VAAQGARGRRQSYLRAKRSIIALSLGSLTFSPACEAESHFTTRSRFSGLSILMRYFKWKDANFTHDSATVPESLFI
jgi:hypothetical protein